MESWLGSTVDPSFELESVMGGVDNRLEIATSFFGGASNANLVIDGADTTGSSVQVFQNGPQVEFDSLDLSSFRNVDTSLDVRTIGDLTVSELSVSGSESSSSPPSRRCRDRNRRQLNGRRPGSKFGG